MKLTTQSLRDLGPCYDPTEYFPEDWEGTLQDILKDDRIPARDRIWVFSEVAPKSKCREFARWCALQVVDLWDAPDTVREYLETGDESLREDVRSAAWSNRLSRSARAASRSASRIASRSASRTVARDAALSSLEASGNAQDAWDTMRQAQLQKALEIVNE